MHELSIKIRNYKCFKSEAGFDDIRKVNLIIGKNNSGKSSLLDIIELVANENYKFERSTWRDNQEPQIIFCSTITEDIANRTFPSNTSGGPINGRHDQYGKKYIGKKITWTKMGKNRNDVKLIHCDDNNIDPPLTSSGDYAQLLPSTMPVPLEGKKFRRIFAERDIVPESDTRADIAINPNGNGITHAIQCFINRSNLPSEVVEIEILGALNEVFAHDATFTDIVCQLHETNNWEIFLEEKDKGRIALSKSGSGLKTVIMVLTYVFIVPRIDKCPLSDYVFGFEELENNIHPALLRRLNDYIYRSSVENNFIYFLTTHSNVLIDQFSRQEDAQILHVTQSEGSSRCTTAKTYVESNGILDDLDVRASDLLQANGVIWVEGPSDRVYLNRWIHLWSKGSLKEGTHYQIIFYGGRLLSHLSAGSPSVVEEGISILNANRNAIIVIDSDMRTQQSRINNTKHRIKQEFDALKSICWITKGREIENYIPSDAVNKFWNLDNSIQVDQYGSFFEHVDTLAEGEGTKYFTKKSMLAERLVGYMTMENMHHILDIDQKLQSICSAIRKWNS